MTDLQAQWIKQVEDYYRDSYPRVMRAKVAELLPRSREALRALFDVVTENVSAQYRTVPDKIAIRKALSEVIEGYPELQTWTTDHKRIEESAGVIPAELWAEVLKAAGFTEGEMRERHGDDD